MRTDTDTLVPVDEAHTRVGHQRLLLDYKELQPQFPCHALPAVPRPPVSHMLMSFKTDPLDIALFAEQLPVACWRIVLYATRTQSSKAPST